MDIAEIRKKAKAKAKSDPVQEASPTVPAAEEVEQQVAAEVEAEDVVVTELALAETDAAAPFESEHDVLDRLFAATDDFVLATDESYAEMLAEKSESQDLAVSQYLAFNLGDEEYALDIKQISEIIKVREFTDIPRAPEFILGIISLRGVVVPVFDLRCRLNLGTSELLPTSRIVVSQTDELTVGLLVDSINQVVNLIDEEIEPPPGVLSGLDREMVFGIGRYQGRMIILLQLQNVLNVELS